MKIYMMAILFVGAVTSAAFGASNPFLNEFRNVEINLYKYSAVEIHVGNKSFGFGDGRVSVVDSAILRTFSELCGEKLSNVLIGEGGKYCSLKCEKAVTTTTQVEGHSNASYLLEAIGCTIIP